MKMFGRFEMSGGSTPHLKGIAGRIANIVPERQTTSPVVATV